MRRRTIRRELAALGYNPHTPSDRTRRTVQLMAFNKYPHEMIARYLGIEQTVLRYWYMHELDMTEAEVVAHATENIFRLADQREDDGIALRANELILRTRSPHWREPKASEPEKPVEDLPVETLTLDQVEKELARIDSPPAAADAASASRQNAAAGSRKP
jgi:hypothetical protein